MVPIYVTDVFQNGASSVPKSVPRYLLDKESNFVLVF